MQTAISSVPSDVVELVYDLVNNEAVVALTDWRGVIVHANQKFCELAGYSREELIGNTHRILRSGLHPHEFYAEMWRTIRAGKVWRGEICNRAKAGHLYWVDTLITPIKVHGEITHFLAVRTDITARKRAEAELADRIREEEVNRRTLATGKMEKAMLHDLNNVLSGVMALTEDIDFPGRQQMLEDAVRRMSQMTRTLRLFAGGEPAEHTVCDLNSLIRCACSIVSFRESVRGRVSLRMDLHETAGIRIRCDEGQVFEMVLNLCVNAAEATAANANGGEVWIRTALDTDEILIAVSDNGPGIAPSVLPRLFQENCSSKGAGRGLGLAASRRIATEHGGALTLHAPGGGGTGGAVFHARLPINIAVSPPRSEPYFPAPQPNPLAPYKQRLALVHEDDELVHRILQHAAFMSGLLALRSDSVNVLERLVAKSTDHIGVAILDSCRLDDPHNSVAMLRAAAPDLPILLISADESHQGPLLTDWGLVEVLPKPFSAQDAAAAIQRICPQSADTNGAGDSRRSP